MSGTITAEHIRLVLDIVQTLGLLLLFVYTIIVRRSKDNTETIDTHAGRLTALDKELAVINETLRHAPDDHDLEKLHTRVSAVKDEVAKIARDVSGIKATVDAIDRSLGLLNKHHIGE